MSFTVYSLAFIEGVGGPEMMMILVITLMLFGGKKLPELARGVGKSIREFKKAAAGVEEEFKRAIEDETPKPTEQKILPAPALASSGTMADATLNHDLDPAAETSFAHVPTTPLLSLPASSTPAPAPALALIKTTPPATIRNRGRADV